MAEMPDAADEDAGDARRSERPQPSASEGDERFPSGPWVGFWLQRPYAGRQWMHGVQLHFCDGRAEGAGADWIGPFTFDGEYDLSNGNCTLRKRYVGGHDLLYEGHNDGDGQWIWGLWRFVEGGDSGGFHLWPKGRADPTVQRAAEELRAPGREPVAASAG